MASGAASYPSQTGLLLKQACPSQYRALAIDLDFSLDRAKSLSCLPTSIILNVPIAAAFLAQGTGFIASRAPKSSPQMKQNPWFERFR